MTRHDVGFATTVSISVPCRYLIQINEISAGHRRWHSRCKLPLRKVVVAGCILEAEEQSP
jgi:hypothetical protein